jgi:hypothetical protein
MSAKDLIRIVILFLPFLLATSGHAQHRHPLTAKYSAAQLQKDALVMEQAVMKIHPVIGIYKSRAYYDSLFRGFRNSLTDSLTEKQFRIKSKQLLEKLHCAHTDISYSAKYTKALKKTKLNFPRYYLMPVNDTVYVLGGLNKKCDTLLKPGDIITHLNGIPADSFYHYGQSLITVDGYIRESKKLYAQLGYAAYYLNGLNYPDTITYRYIRKGELQELKVASIRTLSIPEYNLKSKDDSLFVKYKKARMRYRYLDEDKKTMQLHIIGFSHRKFTKAYRNIFKQLEKNKTENLIIDLRYNGGGSLSNCQHLLSYLLDTMQEQTALTALKKYPMQRYTRGSLMFKFTKLYFHLNSKHQFVNDTDRFVMKIKPIKKYHYRKNLLVLINGGSFSASCVVSAYLKETGRAIFIGRETGGTIEGCNAIITPRYKLPNTKSLVRIPTYRLLHDVYKKPLNGRGILPEYETNYRLNDYLKKKDLEMEIAEQLIKSGNADDMMR